MGSMPSLVETQLITGKELLEMPGIGPCELVEGRIVPMSPTGGRHSIIEGNVVHELKKFVSTKGLVRYYLVKSAFLRNVIRILCEAPRSHLFQKDGYLTKPLRAFWKYLQS